MKQILKRFYSTANKNKIKLENLETSTQKVLIFTGRNPKINWQNSMERERLARKNHTYKCEVCLRCFGNKSGLDRHQRTHTGEKPFSCHVCNKKFALKSSLRRHVAIHSDERKFECQVWLFFKLDIFMIVLLGLILNIFINKH